MSGLLGNGFLGRSTHSVDKKNRVFLAKRFQVVLPETTDGHRTAVLTAGRGGCLWLFDVAGFEKTLASFNTDPFAPEDELRKQRDFFEYAAEVSLDSSGRLLIPQDLKDLAGIGDSCVMVGMVQRVEIWSEEGWNGRERSELALSANPRPDAPREGTA